MRKLKYILGTVVALFLAATSLQAQQQYTDSLRINTWSVYFQGGISGYHGVRSPLYENSVRDIAPQLDLGVKYNYRSWVRFGANLGYTMMKATDESILSRKTTSDFTIDDKPATLITLSDRLQNRNDAHLLGFDLNADFNLTNIFKKERRSHWFNIYAGLGLGYMHGWNRTAETWSYNEKAIAEGPGYAHLYTHSYMVSENYKGYFDALYIPLTASVEFDVLREWTLGIVGQYKILPTTQEFTPKGIYSVGAVIRYNFVKSTGKVYKERIASLSNELDAYRKMCADEQARLNAKYTEAQQKANQEIDRLRKELDGYKADLEKAKNELAMWTLNGSVVLFDHDSYELTEAEIANLDNLAELLKENSNRKIMLIGSANTPGPERYNKVLSNKRLNTVKEYLVNKGVDASQIETEISVGEEGMTEAAKCRRVIIATQK